MEDDIFDDDKSWFRRHWILTTFFVLIILGGIISIFTDSTSITGNVINEQGIKNSEGINQMNEEISVDYLTYKVTKVQTFKEMGTLISNKVAEQEGKFVKVYIEIKNNAEETKEIFTTRFRIKDNQERIYERLSDDALYIADSIEFGKQLQPGLKTSGAIVFEMPEDSDELMLLINGDFASNTLAQIRLNSVENIGEDTTQEKRIEKIIDEELNKCSSPFRCTSSCQEFADFGRKDCPSGEVCCIE